MSLVLNQGIKRSRLATKSLHASTKDSTCYTKTRSSQINKLKKIRISEMVPLISLTYYILSLCLLVSFSVTRGMGLPSHWYVLSMQSGHFISTTRQVRLFVELSESTGLPWWLRWERIHLQCGNMGLIPGLGRSPGGGNGKPLQCFCLENPMDRGAWGLYSPWGRKESTQLSD